MTVVPPITLPTELPPFGGLSSARGLLPLTAMDVRAEIVGLLATTRVRQTFANPFDEHVAATYIFPLPDRAGVTSLVAVLGGRRVEGILKERQAARDEYDAAIAAGQRAALLEEDRPGVFSAKVGNLGPRETAEVEIVLTGPVPFDGGEAAFRFPLVVAPRYVPGQPLEGVSVGDGTAVDTDLVPDASRISPPVLLPGQPNPVALSLEVTIDPLGRPLTNLRSTLHAALVAPGRVALRPGERLDRDFVLRFGVADNVADAEPATTAVVAADEPGGEGGTFAVTVVPPSGGDGGGARRPLHVAVVLDRSGSMGGWKMVAARRAAARIVDSLGAGDHFLVIGFDDQIEHPARLGGALAPATDQNRFAAVEFLAGLEARGGTEMHQPVAQAAAALAAAPGDVGVGDTVLVLVTDGQVAQEDLVLRSVGGGGVRVFTVGIDQAVNAGMLNRLADMTGGRCELVESEDALDEAMTRIHRAASTPVLQDVAVTVDGAALVAGTLAPARRPDCYAGAPCVISGRYRGGRPSAFTLTGRRPAGSAWSHTVTAVAVENRAVRTVWARAHVRALEDRYAAAPRSELAGEITAASLAHGVLSRFTAFVAVDPSDPTGSTSPRPVVQPVEPPRGWAMATAGGAPQLLAAPMAAMPMNMARRIRPKPDVKALLERISEWLRAADPPTPEDREEVARDLDQLAADADDPTTSAALGELAAAVRAWVDVEEKVKAVKGGRRRFWR